MRALDDVMREAAENVRAREEEIPNRHWVSPPVSRRRRPLAALAGAAVVVAAVGLPALWMATPNNNVQGVGGASTADQTALEEGATTYPSETTLAPDDSATTVIEVDPTVTQEQIPQSEFAYLTVAAAGWDPIEATSRDSGRSVSITFLEMTEDGTGDEVVLELSTGISGAWRNDFMRELEISGVAVGRFVSVRGVEAKLWMSESGMWGLEWFEAPGTDAILLLLPDGSNPDVLIELAETLEPMSSDEWAEMITIFGEPNAPMGQARTGLFGGGGEEGTGEFIRLDAPDAAAVILEMAASIELAPGDSIDLVIEDMTTDEPDMMTESGIMSTLEFDAACSWTGYWLDSVAAGDTTAQAEAQDVLNQIPTWPALNATDGGGVIDAWTRNAQLAAAGDVQGVLDNAYTNNCTDVVPGQ